MRILILNASPRRARGNTYRIVGPFVEGATEAGASVETIAVRDLEVKPCISCMSCWFQTPEKCAQDDDMAEILDKARAADVLVLATPVFVDGMTGPLKVVLDRMIPLIRPEMELRDGHMRHPSVDGRKMSKLALISVCGFHEMDNFDPLVSHIEAMCRNMGAEYLGSLLRPHAHAMEVLEKYGSPATQVFDACRQAGRQVAAEGKLDREITDAISRELMPLEMYLSGANESMQRLKAKHGTA